MKKKTILFVSAFISLAAAGGFAQDPSDPGKTNVSFPAADGTTLRGYLALPEGAGPFPGVVLIHEWWGLNRDTTLLADALAKEGFAVLAADAFRGKVAREPAEARKQTTETPAARIASDLDAAAAYLASRPSVRKDRIASWGFCFGGTQSMRMGARNPGLAAVVIFYGGGPFQKPGDLSKMDAAGPVLGVYGAEDKGIPLEQVANFEKALKARGIKNTVTVYPGVGHAFVKSSTFDKGGAPEQAWRQAVNFLKENLK